MKRSKKPTQYLLIKADTRADFEPVNYAIVNITKDWLNFVQQSLLDIEKFNTSADFVCFSYWSAPLGYYYLTNQLECVQASKPSKKDTTFIKVKSSEIAQLPLPRYQLEAQQLLITKEGIAHYRAFAKWTGAMYWTEEFNLKRLLAKYKH